MRRRRRNDRRADRRVQRWRRQLGSHHPRPVRAVPGLLLRPLRHRRKRPADDTANLRHLRPRSPHPPERDRRARPVRRRGPLLRRRPSRDLRRAPTPTRSTGCSFSTPPRRRGPRPAAPCPTTAPKPRPSFVDRCADPAFPTDNPEQLDEAAGFAEVAAIDTLGSLPLSVVTAAEHPFPGLDPVEAARLDDVWNQGQQHWMSLSSAAQLVTVDDTGHYIQLDRPDAVIAEIQKLLPAQPTAPSAGTASLGALRWPPAMRLPRRPRRPRRPHRCHGQPVVGSPPGNGPGRQNRHTHHQPRRTRRVRRRVPRQRRNLQRRDQPTIRHRLLGSPRRRRHRSTAMRLGILRHLPLHRPRPSRRGRTSRSRRITRRQCRSLR